MGIKGDAPKRYDKSRKSKIVTLEMLMFEKKIIRFGWKVHTDINHKHYLENNLVCIANNVPNPRGRNASRDGLVKLGWVHCLQYTLNCFQDNVCGLCRCEPSQGCGSGSGSWKRKRSFSVEAEARKIPPLPLPHRGKNGERKEIGSAILRRRTNMGSISIKK